MSNDNDLAELVECNDKIDPPTFAGADLPIGDLVKASGRIDIVVNSAAVSTRPMELSV